MRTRSYTELIRLGTIEERFDYLSIGGGVGVPTFGFERYLNQRFYQSRQWRQIRQAVIARDLGCDLGVDGYDIYDQVYIHHMNPMTVEDIESGNPDILDPEYLISVTHRTHNAIHYGNRSQLPQPFVERQPGDTKLW
jgi:hypothetical protein